MKKVLYLLMVTTILALAGFNNPGGEQSQEAAFTSGKTVNEQNDSTDLASELEKVLTALKELNTVLENTPRDKDKIQTAGKTVDEDWDRIEKQVRNQHPKDYTIIEQSLYPLIYETKKDQPNVIEIKRYIDETTEKITALKDKLSSSSS